MALINSRQYEHEILNEVNDLLYNIFGIALIYSWTDIFLSLAFGETPAWNNLQKNRGRHTTLKCFIILSNHSYDYDLRNKLLFPYYHLLTFEESN